MINKNKKMTESLGAAHTGGFYEIKNKKISRKELLSDFHGITLIALVITIIILLILAGVSLSLIAGNTGILKRATDATEIEEKAQLEEELQLVIDSYKIDLANAENSTSDEDELFKKVCSQDEFELKYSDDEKWICSKNNYNFSIDKNTFKIGEYLGEIPKVKNIKNFEEWTAFVKAVNSEEDTFEGEIITLKQDITATGEFEPVGTSASPFKGTFDGKNHTIDGISINQEKGYIGVFSYNEGTIKNLTVKGEVNGNGALVGGLCAQSSGTIENCINYITVTNKTTNNHLTAGITAGLKAGGSIINCKNYGNISTNYRGAGGIVGDIYGNGSFLVDECTNYGQVTAKGDWAAGGIVAYIENKNEIGTIQNCVNEKDATIYSKGSTSGGILGGENGTQGIIIQNCINKANVTADTWAPGGIVGNIVNKVEVYECKNEGEILGGSGNAGGIIGSTGHDTEDIYTSKIERCVNTGYIQATGNSGNPSCGGIIGTVSFGDNAEITNCYNVKDVSATNYTSGYVYHGVGGIVGSVFDNATKTKEKSKATITNCYNKGNIINKYSSTYAGQILGRDYNKKSTVSNCYYLDTATGTNSLGGTSKTVDAFKTLASSLSGNFVDGQDGFPKLKWEE